MAKSKTISPEQLFTNAFGASSNPIMAVDADRGALQKLADRLYQSEASKNYMQKQFLGLPKGSNVNDFLNAQNNARLDAFNVKPSGTALANGIKTDKFGASNLAQTGRLLGANIKAHPWATAGTALNAGLNVAGLFDNDKILGQVLGTAGGIILPRVLKMNFGPLGAANAAMIGGNLGALFDNLRAKRERENAAQLPAEMTTY